MSSLRFSFGLSICVHASILVVFILAEAWWPKTTPAEARVDSGPTLTLIAAPAEAAATTSEASLVPAEVPSVEPKPASQTVPPPIQPAEAKIEPAIDAPPSVEQVEPAAAPIIAAPATATVLNPTADASATNRAQGDGSASEPGNDSTTLQKVEGAIAKPDYRKNPEPVYPVAARRRRQEGLVLLTVKVTALGKAAEVSVKTSSGFPLLDEAAVTAVRAWQFEPGRRNSNPVESQIEVPIRFKLAE